MFIYFKVVQGMKNIYSNIVFCTGEYNEKEFETKSFRNSRIYFL